MPELTSPPRDAASVLFNLPGYRVIEAVDLDAGGRQVLVVDEALEVACPECGVLSGRVHSQRVQRLRDVRVGGPELDVRVLRRRFKCVETRCRRSVFTESSPQVPPGARVSTRLRTAVLSAVVDAGRTVSEVAAAHGVAWWTVQSTVNTAATVYDGGVLPDVRWLGIDEHRYRSVRFYRNETGGWARYEPWMSTLVCLDTGRVLGVVDGRSSAGITAWLDAAPAGWRDAVQVVAIDPSAAFRKALRTHLPRAAVSVDAFHLVKLANDMVTAVRQRVIRETQGHRGTKTDLAWTNRRLLLRAGNTLSRNAMTRLQTMFATADTTGEIAAAWAIKEQLRRVIATRSLHEADEAFTDLAGYVSLAGLPEADRLLATLTAWWPQIEVLVVTGVTNARTEAANTTIKQLKRSARGFRNPDHYRARILLHSAARTAA